MLTKQDKEKIALIEMKTRAEVTLRKIEAVSLKMKALIAAIEKRLEP